MKRVLLQVTVALALCLVSSAGFGQGWMPGPAPAMTLADSPVPMMCQPGTTPSMGSSCMPAPPCGPMPCGPSKQASIGGLVGWQFGNDPGGVRFCARERPLIAKTGTRIDYDLSGLWLGVSGRVEASDGVSLRGEYRHFFPSEERSETITTFIIEPDAPSRTFTRSKFQWNVLDGSAGVNLACGVSLVGGVRWDSFELSMRHAPTIYRRSSAHDEGDLTLSTIIPYGGAEFAWAGCEWGALLRIIGTPWMSTWTNYGLTYGNGGALFRGPIRDHIQVNSKYGSFVEASLLLGKKISCNLTASAFGMITSLNAHSQGDMKSSLLEGAEDGLDFSLEEMHRSAPFDVHMTRWTLVLGGNLAVGFTSPL